MPSGQARQCPAPALSELDLLLVPGLTFLSLRGFCRQPQVLAVRRELLWVWFRSSHCLLERKFHTLRISCQGALRVSWPGRPCAQGMEGRGKVKQPGSVTSLGVELGAGVSWSESMQRYLSDTYGTYHMHGPALSPIQVSICVIVTMTFEVTLTFIHICRGGK